MSERVVSSFVMVGAYMLLGGISLAQFIRLQIRLPHVCCNTAKLFHFLLVLICLFRVVTFMLTATHTVAESDLFEATWWFFFLNTIPDTLFFSCYSVLISFWADIFHKATNQSQQFRRHFKLFLKVLNCIIYIIHISFVIDVGVDQAGPHRAFVAFDVYHGFFSILAVLGFMLYGGRVFLLLRSFPIAGGSGANPRQNQLREVGSVTVVCVVCFTLRTGVVVWSIFHNDSIADVLICPVYFVSEVIPSALVLWILRRMPARRPRQLPSEKLAYTPSDPLPVAQNVYTQFHDTPSASSVQSPYNTFGSYTNVGSYPYAGSSRVGSSHVGSSGSSSSAAAYISR